MNKDIEEVKKYNDLFNANCEILKKLSAVILGGIWAFALLFRVSSWIGVFIILVTIGASYRYITLKKETNDIVLDVEGIGERKYLEIVPKRVTSIENLKQTCDKVYSYNNDIYNLWIGIDSVNKKIKFIKKMQPIYSYKNHYVTLYNQNSSEFSPDEDNCIFVNNTNYFIYKYDESQHEEFIIDKNNEEIITSDMQIFNFLQENFPKKDP